MTNIIRRCEQYRLAPLCLHMCQTMKYLINANGCTLKSVFSRCNGKEITGRNQIIFVGLHGIMLGRSELSHCQSLPFVKTCLIGALDLPPFSKLMVIPSSGQDHIDCTGGSRISQRGVRQLQRWGRQPIIFANFPPKLHEIEEILTERGVRPWRPPSPPLGSANGLGVGFMKKKRLLLPKETLWFPHKCTCLKNDEMQTTNSCY